MQNVPERPEFRSTPLGRSTEDDVTSLGNADQHVDGTVRAIVTTYNDRSLPNTVTSYDSPTARLASDVVNQVAYQYDGWSNVLTSQQAHGATAASSGTAPVVTYDNLARLSSVTYDGHLHSRKVFMIESALSELGAVFFQVTDPRKARGVRHP